ncbi:hypothetical protein MAHJHV47_34910 [Mycobacterium avium subsp. hominissuis]
MRCAGKAGGVRADGIPSLAMPTQIVVAGALIRGSRLLVAQRRPPYPRSAPNSLAAQQLSYGFAETVEYLTVAGVASARHFCRMGVGT